MARGTFSKVVSCALGACLSVWCIPAAAWAQDAGEAQPASSEQAAVSPDAASDDQSVKGKSEDQRPSAGEGGSVAVDQEAATLQAPSAEPESAQIADGFYTIHSSIDSAYVLDVTAASNEPGANAQLWSSNGSLAQTWYVSRQDDGTYTIESLCSGLFLDVKWASREAGANVWQYSASGTASQKWKIVARSKMGDFLKAQDAAAKDKADDAGKAQAASADDGRSAIAGQSAAEPASKELSSSGNDESYMLVSECNGLALDVSGANAENGTNVQCYTPNATEAQGFTLQKASALPKGIYAIKVFSDQSKMVEVKWGLRNPGAQAELYAWNGSPAQRWSVAVDPDGLYSFESVCSGLMLTTPDNAGGVVTQTDKIDAGATDSQKWALTGNAAGGFSLVSKTTGLALDLKGGDTYNGNSVQVYGKNGTAAQGFVLKQPATLVSDGYYTIDFWASYRYGGNSASPMRLDVAGASRDSGTNVQLYKGNGTRAQTFHIVPNGDGTYTINIPFSRKALDVRYGGMTPGTNVQQWERNGSDGQKWRIEYNGTGAVRIVSVLNGLALQVAGNSAVDGANIEVGTTPGGVEQLFTLTPTTYVPEDFADHMAHFETYSSNTINGWYNMSRALSNFDGMVVQPGQTVSFFDTCGPCGAAEGYLIAGVVGGEGYGGGICQASTTLYGAVLRAGLTIVERQNHTTPSKYVPIGQDAMVNWGTSDFRFRNDWDFPVKIVVDNHDRTLNCDIWGIQPDWYDTVEVTSWWTGSNSAAGQREYYKNGTLVHTSALPNSWYW